jgi:hypothetical protein
MSLFNPDNRQLKPEEWQDIAVSSTQETGSHFLIVGGMVAGIAIASFTASGLLGLLVASWTIYEAIRRTLVANRNLQAIEEYGCVAHVLKGQNFRDFRAQVGDAVVIKQVKWALSNEFTLSHDALDFYEQFDDNILPAAEPTLFYQPPVVQFETNPTQNYLSQNQPLEIGKVTVSQPTVKSNVLFTPDLAGKLADDLKNTLIVGVPGAGKGVFVSNALQIVKQTRNNVTVFYLDPKNDPKESGYFATGRVDKLYQLNILESTPREVFDWLQKSFADYEAFDTNGVGYKLLVVDDLVSLTASLKQVEGGLSYLATKLSHYSSAGPSRGFVIWCISQNAHLKGLGLDGGTMSIFTPIFLISALNIPASTALLRVGMVPSDKKLSSNDIQAICQKSTIGRAIYHGGLNTWYPMPILTNYSGYDRDNLRFVGDEKQANSVLLQVENIQTSSPIENMVASIETTRQPNIDGFLTHDLKVFEPLKREMLKKSITQVLRDKQRFDLLQKLGIV